MRSIIRYLRSEAVPAAQWLALTCYSRASALVGEMRFSVSFALRDFELELSHRRKPKTRLGWVTAFEEADIAPGDQKVFDLQPQTFYKIRKIIATGDTDELFVTLFAIGQKLQLPAPKPIPLVAFAPFMLNDVDFDICHPALTVCIQVHNRSRANKRFSMVMSGDAVL